ncbi:MAG: AAA family ATPase [Burkholderiaceae bacterium]
MKTGTEPSAPSGEHAFVGREKELAAIHESLGLAIAGNGRVVMLAGPPGIGKTRTAQQVSEHAAAHDMLVLWGRCPEEPGAPPYWPWLQAVRLYVAVHDEATVLTHLGAAAAHLAALDPGIASRLPPQQPIAVPADPAQARFQLFDAITGFWQRAAADQPLLLVFDDLHCADVPSLRLLEFVASDSAASRVLLLGTFRDAEVTRSHPLSDTLALLSRQAGTQRLKLGGFSQEETAQFIGGVGSGLSPGLAVAMHKRSEGHPLFLAEMTRLLDETRGAEGDGTQLLADLQRVPTGVRETACRRFATTRSATPR